MWPRLRCRVRVRDRATYYYLNIWRDHALGEMAKSMLDARGVGLQHQALWRSSGALSSALLFYL